MHSDAKTVDEYIASLPVERQQDVKDLRAFILKNLPRGYEEGMLFGMITYCIPLKDYPDTYNKQPLCYMALASQKDYLSLYVMGMYGQPENETWLQDAFVKAGKKLNMGKSCIRFKALDDLPLDAIAKVIALMTPKEYIALYEKNRQK